VFGSFSMLESTTVGSAQGAIGHGRDPREKDNSVGVDQSKNVSTVATHRSRQRKSPPRGHETACRPRAGRTSMTRVASTTPIPSALLLYIESSRRPATGKEPKTSSTALATASGCKRSWDDGTRLLKCRISRPWLIGLPGIRGVLSRLHDCAATGAAGAVSSASTARESTKTTVGRRSAMTGVGTPSVGGSSCPAAGVALDLGTTTLRLVRVCPPTRRWCARGVQAMGVMRTVCPCVPPTQPTSRGCASEVLRRARLCSTQMGARRPLASAERPAPTVAVPLLALCVVWIGVSVEKSCVAAYVTPTRSADQAPREWTAVPHSRNSSHALL